MQFHSLEYIVFLPVVTIIYFLLPFRLENTARGFRVEPRAIWLLAVSYFFYMRWEARYALLMLTSTAITYTAGLLIGQAGASDAPGTASVRRKKKLFVALSFTLNLAILFFFKYFNFVMSAGSGFLSFVFRRDITAAHLSILLPVGISFYTFQALGYTMDVYRGTLAPEKNFVRYALFVSFFPQLVAGPIERAPNLLHQFDHAKRFDFDRMKSGLLLLAWGMFKKMVVADRLAVMVNTVYNDVYSYRGATFALATAAFAFQIYCDFSAYSDIARGSARIMGFSLMKNFDAPYFSQSIREFWRRWHISLSTWFRDYLYYPLGGNRKGLKRKNINLMIVFIVSGVWHGAGFTFIAWGLLNGLYQIAESFVESIRTHRNSKLTPREPAVRNANFSPMQPELAVRPRSLAGTLLRVTVTFVLTCFSWIFFRANTMSDAFYIVRGLFLPGGVFMAGGEILGLDAPDAVVALCSVLILLIVDLLSGKTDLISFLQKQNLVIRWAAYLCIIFTILIFGYYGGGYEPQTFLYFQF